MKIAPLLKNQFDTLNKVQELIKNGVWNNIVSPKDTETLKRFTEWTKRDDSQYYIVPVGKCHTINKDGSMTFADFETANGQDISYLYLFYPGTNEWKIFK